MTCSKDETRQEKEQLNLNSINFGIISRKPSAATATGYGKVHAKEQSEIIDTAFSI